MSRNTALAAVGLVAAVQASCSCPLPSPATRDGVAPPEDVRDDAAVPDGPPLDAGGADGGVAGGQDAGGSLPPDPTDPANATKDSDCDGLSDAEEFGNLYASGKKTDPANPDSDGDGLLDGVESGRALGVDPACSFIGDVDTLTRTSPVETDSDADGISDGLEDANGNGTLDPGETDPTSPDSDGDGIADGVEDTDHDGQIDPGEANPRVRDTDGDGINDWVEKNVTGTDPTRADTDGDLCPDGLEDFNQDGVRDPGETSPLDGTDCGPSTIRDSDGDGLPDVLENATGTDSNLADTDRDGLSDGVEDRNHNGVVEGNETDPRRIDSDCDGLIDGPDDLARGYRGEDQNRNGVTEPGETSPVKFDTDGDGIRDGVERSVVVNPDPTHCPQFVPDADPATSTLATRTDTDGDGIPDGAEDSNQNGKVEPGELDPNDATTGVDGGPAGKVCTLDKLRPVIFREEGQADLQVALADSFTELATVTAGGQARGLMGFDPTHDVAFLLYRETQLYDGGAPDAGSPNQDQLALYARLLAGNLGSISLPIVQNFTTWDGFAAQQAFYDNGSPIDVKTRANQIANALLGPGSGALTAGGATPASLFRIQAEYVHRSAGSVVALFALTPLENYQAPAIFKVTDTAGGSALAQFGDTNAIQCETFTSGTPKVDFLFVVDDSCSMASSQAALSDTATAVANELNASSLDWRIAMVTTGYHTVVGGNGGVLRGFTRNIDEFIAWLTSGSTCVSGVCSLPVPDGGPFQIPLCPGGSITSGGCWVGTTGSGAEGSLGAARKAVDAITLDGGTESTRKRGDATLVVVLLGDADDQTTGYSTTQGFLGFGSACPLCEDVMDFVQYFQGTGATSLTKNPTGAAIPVHGIICPDSNTNCNSEFQNPGVQRNGTVVDATGGFRGSLLTATSIASTMKNVIGGTIAAAGYKLLKPPMGASVKVAVSGSFDAGCPTPDDLPRSRLNGFDFDGVNRTVSFFGACRPYAVGTPVAVSYRYWVDVTGNVNGTPPPCVNDPAFDPNAADFCLGPLVCNLALNVCECPSDCGGPPPPNQVCNANKLVCAYQCTADCGGTCLAYELCEPASCTCQCVQNASCAPGFAFQNAGGSCGCICSEAALACPSTHQADLFSCACVCKPDCGGCPGSCNASTCTCSSGPN